MDGIDIKFVKEAPTADVVRLYKEAGWWDDSFDESFIPEAIRNSYCFVGAFAGGRLVGMARSFSDGVSDAYILDIAVLKEFRGRGVARRMVSAMVSHLESLGVDWITGIGAPEAMDFYRRIGISAMEGFVPLRFSGSGLRGGD